MIGKEQLSERPLTLSEVKSVLSARKKDNELTFEQKAAFDYSSDFSTGTEKKVQDAVERLKAEGVEERIAVKLADLLPKTKDELVLIFEKTRFDLKEEAVQKVLDILAELR